MPVNLSPPDPASLSPVAGVELGFAEAGIRKAGRRDLMLVRLAPGTRVAGVFTQNSFAAAPVQVCREHLALDGEVRALVVNAGNANCGTGERGLADARLSCEWVASAIGCKPSEVLPFSTGVILEPLPMPRIQAALPACVASLGADHWAQAAAAIMTTDTVSKGASAKVALDGAPVTITGIAKGVGMLQPNMATMLAYLATDAAVSGPVLKALVRRVADRSFNRVTVDGDTSTNDSFVLMATGQSGAAPIAADADPRLAVLEGALVEVAAHLAQAIARDGEGATKFMAIQVEGGRNVEECRQIAYAVAHSPLVKTAFYASDPNLGRILAAVGYAGVTDLDVNGVNLWLDDVWVARDGGRNPDYREEDGQRVMKQTEITVRIALGRGDATATVWTCDFSHDYVSINADYRS